jgi:hypothetical protein
LVAHHNVSEGFHRIGVALAAIPAMLAVASFFLAIYGLVMGDANNVNFGVGFGAAAVAVAGLLYGACRAIGWILNGFRS